MVEKSPRTIITISGTGTIQEVLTPNKKSRQAEQRKEAIAQMKMSLRKVAELQLIRTRKRQFFGNAAVDNVKDEKSGASANRGPLNIAFAVQNDSNLEETATARYREHCVPDGAKVLVMNDVGVLATPTAPPDQRAHANQGLPRTTATSLTGEPKYKVIGEVSNEECREKDDDNGNKQMVDDGKGGEKEGGGERTGNGQSTASLKAGTVRIPCPAKGWCPDHNAEASAINLKCSLYLPTI